MRLRRHLARLAYPISIRQLVMSHNLETSPDCCERWLELRGGLEWFTLEGDDHIRVMPCIYGVRVNHCPACGAERRSAIWNTLTDPR